MKNIMEFWKQQRLSDGAMGTYFAQKYPDCREISEWANLHAPEKIRSIHQEYIKAGANLIRTNTFAAHQKRMGITKEEQKAVVEAAVRLAKEAVEDSKKEVLIAGDIGPITEMNEETSTERKEDYKVLCDVFLDSEIPVILMETFGDTKEPLEIAEYIKQRKKETLVFINFCVNMNGNSARGISAQRLLDEAGRSACVDGVGLNCGVGSGHMISLLDELQFPEGKISIAMPNAGYPEQIKNRMVFLDNAGYFTDNMKKIAEKGFSLIGACCGTTPVYIQKMAAKLSLEERKQNILVAASVSDGAEEKQELSGQTGMYEKPVFMQKLEHSQKVIAVELDPPYDGNVDKVLSCARELKKRQVDIITMADSPMGRSRADSVLTSLKLNRETGMQMMPHLCCRDKNMIAMRSMLLGLHMNGLRNLLIVTGDPVPGETRDTTTGVFDYNSIQLMNFVKQLNEEQFEKDPLYYGGALNYGIGFVERQAERMQKKMEAGASYFLTQPIFSDEDIRRVERLKELTGAKILCGIMPLVSYRNAFFIKHEMTGIRVPDEIMGRYQEDMSREAGEETGTAIAAELMKKMDSFADGYYFMLPFNRVSIMERLEGYR